ncbi:MAG: hypothetical protein NT062_01965 [Proteobacteria bacterium]|nr:hypothetical protein [Pseudomonadota bacterium]
MRALLLPALLLGLIGLPTLRPSTAEAAPKKYNFELVRVIPKPEVAAELAKVAVPRIEGVIKAGITASPRLVSLGDNPPDPKTKPDAFKALLAKKGIASAYRVTVDVADATEELQPIDGKPSSQRLVVHLSIHMLGENVPAMTMGFSGDGSATIKIEIGKKVRARDREYAWDEVAKLAVDKALDESLKQLDTPPKKKKK